MRAGKLRHRVTVQRLAGGEGTPTLDSFGGVAGPWEDVVRRLPVSIQPLRGAEYHAAAQSGERLTHRIGCRFRTDIAAEMRIVYGSRVFAIKTAHDPDERRRELEIMAIEQSPTLPAGHA